MAFAQVASTSQASASGSSVSVTLPTGTATGDLLVVIFSIDGTPTVTHTGTGWTQDGQANVQAGAYVFWKVADGTDSLTINYSVTEVGGWVAYRITDHGGELELARAANATVDSAPNPPSLTPSWGAADTLWIAGFGSDDGTKTLSTYPANYTSNQLTVSSGTSASTVTAAATRELNAATENPDAFSLSGSDYWVAFTIAVKPAGSSPSGSVNVTDAADVVAVVGSAPAIGSVAVTDAADAVSVAGQAPAIGSVAVADAADVVAVVGSAGSAGVRLQFGVRQERGGEFESQTIEYWVFSADRLSIVDRGFTTTEAVTGVATVDVTDGGFSVGDNVLVSILQESAEPSVLDRTIRSGMFYVPAIAIP
jgi:hypothetical protein